MTFKEMEKTMAFILEQQAQSTVKQAKADERIDRLERVVTLAVRAGQRERRETRDKINALIHAQTRAEERHAETEEKIGILTTAMTDLAQALTATNKRVDGLESNGKKAK